MLGLGEIFRGVARREGSWAETQCDQPDTVLMPDWVPEEADHEMILLADIAGR